jgi:DNA processing protein
MLYLRGDPTLLHAEAVAIIGSRDHSRYGARMAQRLGEVSAGAGVVVVSGMARGLDAVAQSAALEAGGSTIGVLGTGADVVYPRQNHALFTRVLEGGLLVTEFPPGTEPQPGSFPRRNRIISGLSRALVVVEATEGSGTLITVHAALEQGREVLAVPGPIDVPTSRGTNRLIRDGATPLLDPEELPALLGVAPANRRPADAPAPSLTPDEARVHGALTHDPIHIDTLALSVGLPMGTLLGTLLGLELGGYAEQLPGSHFRRR